MLELVGQEARLAARRSAESSRPGNPRLSASLIAPPFFLSCSASSLGGRSRPGRRALAIFQARLTSERTSSRGGDVRRDVLDLAGEESRAQEVGQLLRLVEPRLGIEELVGELPAAAQRRHADLGVRDLAVPLGLLAREQRRELVIQALALGQLLEVRGRGQDRGGLRVLLLGLLDLVEGRRVLVGERDQDVVLDLRELLDDLGLGLLLGEPRRPGSRGPRRTA